MTRLLILTQYFPPEMGAAQARISEIASKLFALGWTVEVLTALPNYPCGQIFDGYKGKKQLIETINGIKVARTWLWPSASLKILPRLVCYLSFVYSAATLGPKLCHPPDIIWLEIPPLFLGWAAKRLSHLWKAPLVINVSDLWPESFVYEHKMRPDSWKFRLLEYTELNLYSKAAGVTGQSKEIIKSIRQRCKGVQCEVITNGVDPEKFGKAFRDLNLRNVKGWSGKCVFIYAGLHGLAQGLDQIINVAKRLQSYPNILFCLVGDGPLKKDLVMKAQNEHLQNVKFYPIQSKKMIARMLASADVALVTLSTYIMGAVPSKIYEAMASELPILLVAEGEAADRVKMARAGVVVPCGDLDKLEEAVIRLANDPLIRQKLAANGRKAAEQIYCRESIAIKLSEFLKRVLSNVSN